MDKYMIILSVAVVLFVISVALIVFNQLELRRTYRLLNEMLDDVIAGNFKEQKYDESMMSKISAKLKRFLLFSQLSHNRLHQEKEAMKALISDISHQTKTPMTNMMLYLQLLLEKPHLPKDTEQLNLIKKQSEKLAFLVQALVKTSRLEAGIIAVRPTRSLVNNAVFIAISQVSMMAEQKGIILDSAIEDEFYAFIDSKWTIEAIYNVMDNAIKYTPHGGRVSITLQEYELFVRLDIKDTGIGIPEEDFSSIFQRFYRGQNTEGKDGVGIGLYLTRQILTKQGGYIKVGSKLGEGSTFSLFFRKNPQGEGYETMLGPE